MTAVLFFVQGRAEPPAQGHVLLDWPGDLQAPLAFLISFLTLPACSGGSQGSVSLPTNAPSSLIRGCPGLSLLSQQRPHSEISFLFLLYFL